MIKVSVIVPVYKVEKFLPLCLKSLSKQTFNDFEVICIDDGSPDACGKILDDYAVTDKRFKIIHQMNGGLSVARNTGISHISAPYVMFVDSDDALHPQALELAVKTIEKHNADIVWFDTLRFQHNQDLTYPIFNNSIDVKPCLTSPLRSYAIKPLWRHKKSEKITGLVWNKIYRSHLVKETLFEPHLSPGEDNLFTLEMMAKAQTIVHLKAPLYYYRCNPDSIMHSLDNKKITENLFVEMNGYINLQKRIENGVFSDTQKRIIKKYIATFYFRKFLRPFLKQKNPRITQNDVDKFLYNSDLDFTGLNIRYHIPLFLYQKGWIKLAQLLTL